MAVALFIMSAPIAVQAKQWSLQDCISYALANNIQLQKTQLTKASAQEDYLQSKSALLPSLSASTNQSVNYTPWVSNGISGEGFSKASIDKVYYNGSYSVMGNYTIWNGNKNRNQVKLNKLAKEAAQLDSTAQTPQPARTDSSTLRTDTLLYRGYQRKQRKLSVECSKRRAW